MSIRDLYGGTVGLFADFMKRFNVRLYAFRPDVLYYQDNRIQFSFRERVNLE